MSRTTANPFVSDKREAILRAAIKVFAGKGYFNSKVADIAKEAGIADGTVYLYFKSKDDILRSFFDRAMSDFIAEGKRELTEIDGAEARLRRIAHFTWNGSATTAIWQSFFRSSFAIDEIHAGIFGQGICRLFGHHPRDHC